MADYTKKLYIGGTDIVDVIKDTADAAALPDITTAGSVGPTANVLIKKQNYTDPLLPNWSVTIPYFTVDAKGRVTSKQNRTLQYQQGQNYYNHYNHSDYDNYD